MDDALGADAFALAVEAEVEDVLVGMFSALLFARHSCHQLTVGLCRWLVRVVPDRLPLVALLLVYLAAWAHLLHPLHPIVGCSRFGVALGRGGLGGGNELLQFSDAFGVEGGAFVADLADDALSGRGDTLAGFFFFISKARRSEAQSRQRSWLHASIRMSSGSFLHLVQGCG